MHQGLTVESTHEMRVRDDFLYLGASIGSYLLIQSLTSVAAPETPPTPIRYNPHHKSGDTGISIDVASDVCDLGYLALALVLLLCLLV